MERKLGTGTTRASKEAQVAEMGRKSAERANLDSCYGRVGIPAVAAAITPRHHEQRRTASERHVMPWDRD